MAPKDYVSDMAQKCAMEALGTAVLCFTVGTAAGQGAALAPVSIGAVLMCIVYFGGHISGGQYNPAVALTIFLRGKMTPIELAAYSVSQIAGGFIGGLLAMLVLASGEHKIGFPIVPDGVGVGSALVGEIVTTFALCHVILHVATTSAQASNSYYGLAIGFTVLAGAVGVGPFSGGAFNPAVGIALPLLRGQPKSLWIYIVGPCIGSALAALVFAFTHSNELPGTGPLRGIKAKFKDSPRRKFMAPIIIEFIGTGLLGYSIATAGRPNGSPLAPLAIGSTLMCQIYAGGATSGGQFNPAVTLGIAVRKLLASTSTDSAAEQLKAEFTNLKTIMYVVAQCAGALVGGLLGRLTVMVGGVGLAIGAPVVTGGYGSAFVAEVVATFLLVFVVLQSATSSKTAENEFYGIAIGFVVVSMAVAVGGVSGGALNPAVGLLTLVNRTVSGTFWLYWVACPLGGVLAAFAFRLTNAPEFAKTPPEMVKTNTTVFADTDNEEVAKKTNVLQSNKNGAPSRASMTEGSVAAKPVQAQVTAADKV